MAPEPTPAEKARQEAFQALREAQIPDAAKFEALLREGEELRRKVQEDIKPLLNLGQICLARGRKE